MADQLPKVPRILRVTLLVAKIVGTVFAAFLVFMMIGYAVTPQGDQGGVGPGERSLMLFFPVGLSVGYLMAWRWTLLGSAFCIGCLILFLIVEGRTDQIGTMAILGAPAVVMFLCGWLARRHRLDVTSV